MEAFRTEVRLGYTDVIKILSQPVGAHTFKPSTGDSEAGGSL